MSKLVLMGQLKHIDGKKFISFKTKGNQEHILPITTRQDFDEDAWVILDGELRTASAFDKATKKFHKRHFGTGSLSLGDNGVYMNALQIPTGTVVRVCTLRTTPLTNRKIVDFVVAEGNDYYNCIAFGEAAQRLTDSKAVGDAIDITNSKFQSRKYIKDGETRTAYEVCVSHFQ